MIKGLCKSKRVTRERTGHLKNKKAYCIQAGSGSTKIALGIYKLGTKSDSFTKILNLHKKPISEFVRNGPAPTVEEIPDILSSD